jgi:uncharacterized protein YebE (UPF0316 family)
MQDIPFLDSQLFTWVVLPLLIFIARIADQSMGTLRVIFISKGYKYLAPLIGFFESIIWLLAVSQIMQHLDNIVCFLAYGAGFGMGNYVGILLEEKLSLGNVIVRVIPRRDTTELLTHLRETGFGFTLLNAEGSKGPVKVIFLVVRRQQAQELIHIINKFNPNAFYTIEDVKAVKEGVFSPTSKRSVFESLGLKIRKAK